jgi:hypothetical protein
VHLLPALRSHNLPLARGAVCGLDSDRADLFLRRSSRPMSSTGYPKALLTAAPSSGTHLRRSRIGDSGCLGKPR